MKVTGQKPTNLAELTMGKAKGKGQKDSASKSLRSRENEAVANHTSLTTRRIKETLNTEPDVRVNRVAEVKEKIKDGKYKVNPEKLAEEMLMASLKEDLEKA